MGESPFTAALHADAVVADGPDVAPPIHVATTFDRDTQDEWVYRRDGHHTTVRLEAVLGALEGGHAVMYPSGMAAVAAALSHVRPRRVSLPQDVYHGVRALVGREAAAGRWEVVVPERLEAGDVWWVETPSNPKCLVTDIAAVAASARERGVVVVVDSTFATPVLQRPLALGAHLVMHSTTKFIAGHSDSMGGVLVSADADVASALRHDRHLDGDVPGALETWLALRGVRTLPLRIERQCQTAASLVDVLLDLVPRVWYPLAPTQPDRDVALGQMAAGGAVVSVELVDYDAAQAAVAKLRLFRRATSLGGVESLAEHRRAVDEAAPPGLIRLSVGLEDPADLAADVTQAFG